MCKIYITQKGFICSYMHFKFVLLKSRSLFSDCGTTQCIGSYTLHKSGIFSYYSNNHNYLYIGIKEEISEDLCGCTEEVFDRFCCCYCFFCVFFWIVGIRFVVLLMWITCILSKANFKEIHSFIHVFLLLVLLM